MIWDISTGQVTYISSTSTSILYQELQLLLARLMAQACMSKCPTMTPTHIQVRYDIHMIGKL